MKNILLIILFINSCFSKELFLTSHYPLKLIIEPIIGTQSEIKSLLNPEEYPSDYKLNKQNILQSGRVLAYFYSSENFEKWSVDLPAEKKINLSEFISEDSRIYLQDSIIADFWWIDPKIVIDIIPKIADTLGKLNPENANFYKNNGSKLIENIKTIDAYTDKVIKNRHFNPIFEEVPALVYFAESYKIPYSDFMFFDSNNKKKSYNSDFTLSVKNGKPTKIISTTKLDSMTKETLIDLELSYYPIEFMANKNINTYYDYIKYISIKVIQAYSE